MTILYFISYLVKMFQGDIRKASGDLKRFQDNCEYILFTEDERIIKKINDNDWLN